MIKHKIDMTHFVMRLKKGERIDQFSDMSK